jgi:lactate permease
MDHSGEITVLALGIAQVAPPTVYTVASTITGALGVLITSSNNASNILLAPLQETAARALGVPVELAVAFFLVL